MTRDDMIRLARQAGWEYADNDRGFEPLWAFAALIRDHLLSTEIHSCHANCQRFACVQTRKAVEAEREACAKVAEDMAKGYEERAARPEEDRDINPDVARIAVMTCGFAEAAIRARGQQ